MDFVVARRSDLLCGRLMALYYAMAISNKYNCGYGLTWPNAKMANPDVALEEVFSSEYQERIFVKEKRFWQELVPNSQSLENFAGVDAANNLVVEANHLAQIPVELRSDPMPTMASLLPKNALHKDLRQCLETSAFGTDMTGVHVRHGDVVDGNWKHFGHMMRFVPYDVINWYLDKLGKRENIVVFSDESNALEQIQLAPRGESKEFRTLAPYQSVHLDLSDLFQMAHCSQILCPERSAYSAFAAVYYGAERSNLTLDVATEWVRDVPSVDPVSVSAAYYCKRNLYIVEAIERAKRVSNQIEFIDKLLAEAYEIYPENAQIYALRLKYKNILPTQHDAEKDMTKYVELVGSEKGGVMCAQGVAQLNEVRAGCAQAKTRDLEILQTAVTELQAIQASL